MAWTFRTIEKNGRDGYSAAMSREKALALVAQLLAMGARVIKLESDEGESFGEAQIRELYGDRRLLGDPGESSMLKPWRGRLS